jgi:hypothetical protein
MSNVYHLLDHKMNRHFQTFYYNLEEAWKLSIARYSVEHNHRQVRSVFNSLKNLIRSRSQALEALYVHSAYAILYEKRRSKLDDIRARLADDRGRVVISLHKRIANNNVDLDDPRALAAFRAASEILYHFLQLEHEYMRTYLEEAQTHLRLRRARRRQQTLQLLQSKPASPQEAEGTG